MGARSELGKLVSDRLVPFFADLEDLVFRHGYLRVFGALIPLMTVTGTLGLIFGLSWLRIAFVTLVCSALVGMCLLSFAGSRELRARVNRSEALLHRYAKEVGVDQHIPVRSWREEIFIEENGDASFYREVIVGAVPKRGMPARLRQGLSQGGVGELTPRLKRLVKCRPFHASAHDQGLGTRAKATSIWNLTEERQPRLEVYVFFDEAVGEGDRVTLKWSWPSYSADLMRGRAPEHFYSLFHSEARSFEYSVTFRGGAEGPNRIHIRSVGHVSPQCTVQGVDLKVSIAGEHPKSASRVGFVADRAE